MRFFILFIVCLLSASTLTAQDLPRYMTVEEESRMPAYLEATIKNASRAPDLPTNPRAMAEWEELQGIAISWSGFLWQIQAEIVRHASKEVIVYINTTNEAQVKSQLDLLGVDYSQNVEFINANYNSLWIRDYGPNSVYINKVDSLLFVDWIYNRPRPFDDQIPAALGAHLNVSVLETASPPDDLVHTGGNFMSNGNGQGFSSELILEENGPNNNWGISNHTEGAIDDIMHNFMGIKEYIKMVNLPFDIIHHIDMHMKMIDEETIIVGKYPEGIADGPQIEANIQYVLDNFQSTFNRPINIIRIPMPPDFNDRYPDQNGDYRTYANAMLVNKTVLVPTYEERYDTTGLRIWQEALPGHTIVGIDCNDIIPLSGALHCIIKEIGVSDPIWILHKPIVNPQIDVPSDWTIDAIIQHKDPIAEAFVYYSVDGGAYYDSIAMTQVDSLWQAQLPQFSSEVIYYIKAIASTGKTIEKPQTGSRGGGWRFQDDLTASIDIRPTLKMGKAFPNPATAITAVPFNVDKVQKIEVSLLDMTGRKVDVLFTGEYFPNKDHLFFDASAYAPGVYLIMISNNEFTHTQKIIIE